MRLDVSVHDPAGVAEVEGFEEFVDVVPDVEVGEFGVKRLEILVVDVFEDDGRRLGLQRSGDDEEHGTAVNKRRHVPEDRERRPRER